VREVAKAHALDVAGKPRARRICFVPDGTMPGSSEAFADVTGIDLNPTLFQKVTSDSRECAWPHLGIHHYTIGQRRGLRMLTAYLYMSLNCIPTETSCGRFAAELAKRECRVIKLNWISITERGNHAYCGEDSLRHHEAAATVTPLENGSVKVEFDVPQLAVTPGQACVFYQACRVGGDG